MSPTTDNPPPRPLGLDPVVLGTACCIVSALCYTAANICLRKLAVEADKMWTICIKEVVTVAVVGPWLLMQAFRGRRVLPPPGALLALVLTGLAVQLAGNLPMQWAFDVVGIAVTVPAVFGVTLVASAAFGLVFLGERVSGRAAAAIGLLIGSIVLLSLGKLMAGGSIPQADAAVADLGVTAAPRAASGPARVVLGVGAGCLAGAMFAMLSTVIRFTAAARVPVTTIVFVITGMGVVSLGSLSVRRLGTETLLHTDPGQFRWMLAAGAFNLVAFLAITKGLQLTTVVRANVLNASQVAMAALAGMMLFREPQNVCIHSGVVLTILGLLLIGQPSGRGEGVRSEGVQKADEVPAAQAAPPV